MTPPKTETPPSLEGILSRLTAESFYQSPGGRRMLIGGALLAGLPRGARVVDVQCGIGSAAIDLAEAFGSVVTAFDDYPPYLAFGRQQATSRGVAKQITFTPLSGDAAMSAFPEESFDVVIGLGGGLSDTLPGGLAGSLQAASQWLSPGGIVICGDLVAPGEPSELMQIVFGESLLSEDAYLGLLDEHGFDVIFACRSTGADWDAMHETMDRLRSRSLDLGPPDERQRQRLTAAARNHPEIAYLNVVARKRAS